jgi:hypothetical protein
MTPTGVRGLKVSESQTGDSAAAQLPVVAGQTVSGQLLSGGAAAAKPSLLGTATKRYTKAGKPIFKVPLNGMGRQALRHRGRLMLTLKLVAVAPGRAASTVSKSVTLRAKRPKQP